MNCCKDFSSFQPNLKSFLRVVSHESLQSWDTSFIPFSACVCVWVCVLTPNASSGFLVSSGFLFLLKSFKSQKKMGIWVFKSFSPHHLCLLTMKRSPKNSHIQKAWHEQSSQKQQQQQHEHEEETKMQKSKQRPKKRQDSSFTTSQTEQPPKEEEGNTQQQKKWVVSHKFSHWTRRRRRRRRFKGSKNRLWSKQTAAPILKLKCKLMMMMMLLLLLLLLHWHHGP